MKDGRLTAASMAAFLALQCACAPIHQDKCAAPAPPPGVYAPGSLEGTPDTRPAWAEDSSVQVATESSTPAVEAIPRTLLRSLYYERELFLAGISAPRTYDFHGELRAGVIPHHLLASDMIAGFFALAAQRADSFDTVLIMSTSHFPENCGSRVATALTDWDTPYGRVQGDDDIAIRLLQNPAIRAENNPAAAQLDHGVAGLVPFVQYYLPNAKVAVCLVDNNLTAIGLAGLRQEVGALLAETNTLFVASVDFSHYLMPEQARQRDNETAAVIARRDYARIRTFDDGNVDSPQTLEIFLSAVESMGLSLAQLDHSSSADKLPYAISHPIYNEGITTYFVYAAVSG